MRLRPWRRVNRNIPCTAGAPCGNIGKIKNIMDIKYMDIRKRTP